MTNLGERIARVEEKLDSYHAEVTRLLNDEIKPIKEQLEDHAGQIDRWRGAFMLLALAWTSLLAWLSYHGRVLK